MAKLAFTTVGILHEAWGHPRVQGFVDRIPAVFESAEALPGFVERSRFDRENGTESWGTYELPKCFPEGLDMSMTPSTLSLWTDLESVAAFAYHGAHGEAMGQRREWFRDHDAPTYAAWWVEDGHQPDWSEAAERIERLHAEGPTPFAFDFKRPFDAVGQPATLDRERIKTLAAAV